MPTERVRQPTHVHEKACLQGDEVFGANGPASLQRELRGQVPVYHA